MAASNWVGGTTGNDNLAGGPGRDYIFGNLGDDRLSGAGGDDILVGDNSKFAGWYADDPPLTSKDHLDGGAGNDILIGGGDDDVLIGGAGRDVFVLDGIGATGDDGSNYDFGLGSGRDIAVDFVHGQDRIAIAVEDDVPVGDLGEPGSNVVNYYGFADFDTNGDGRLTGADGDHVTIENITYGGQTKLSTVLHYGGDLVVFGDTALTPADFTETGQDPATRFFWAGPHLPIFGSFDADQLTGTAADDGIVGFAGNDVIDAGAGNDAVYAGTGDDLVHGGHWQRFHRRRVGRRSAVWGRWRRHHHRRSWQRRALMAATATTSLPAIRAATSSMAGPEKIPCMAAIRLSTTMAVINS